MKSTYYAFTLQQILIRVDIDTFGEFFKTWSFGQIVLPDRSLLIRQKLVENAKIEKKNMKCDIFSNFIKIVTVYRVDEQDFRW